MSTPRSAADGIIEEGGAGAVGGAGDNDDVVFVAVGKSVQKARSVLQWTLSQFADKKVRLLHVHQPSPRIPTLLGKLPASQANTNAVAAYRKEEWEKTLKLLNGYLCICSNAKVKSSFVAIESDHIGKGIVELVNKLCIKNLVMGTVRDSVMKVKRRCRKADYAAKNASLLCEIWFINKGKLVSTRKAAESPSSLSTWRQPAMEIAENFSHLKFQHNENESESFPSDFLQSISASFAIYTRNRGWIEGELVHLKQEVSSNLPSSSLQTSSSENSSRYFLSERRISSASDSRVEEENLNCLFTEDAIEAEGLRNKSTKDGLKCKNLELVAMEAMNKAKVLESACVCECKLRKEAESALRAVIQEQEKLTSEREQLQLELQRTMKNIALLDCHTQSAKCRLDEAAAELELIQSSISILWQEKQKFKQQKMKALHWLERWRSGQARSTNCKRLIGFVEELPQLAEFSVSEIQTATCNFSESFRIGQVVYGSIYKGEMMGRTVAITKLHPHSMLQPSEFQQEAYVLGELQHPHLVTLLGVCTEAWSLIYEYLSNGSLQNHLFQKGKTPPLTWKIRARIIAEMASALCFLHSSKPENLVHGDLKPENILLDSELSCKIGDFGICRLVSEEFRYFQSLQMSAEPKGAFSYTDPEFHRTRVLTPQSDIYSFGLIILQLLTGKPTVGLASEVRNALSCGQFGSVLDSSAGEWPMVVARGLVEFGLKCCELKSRYRPEITPATVRELELLYVSEERPVPPYFLCPILQEIMQDPHVAADGFTYDGEAIRGWLENDHETSPMTNLRLNHLHLTPNHNLRLAIHDWLCKT